MLDEKGHTASLIKLFMECRGRNRYAAGFMLGRDEEVGWLIFSPVICMLLQASLVDINLTTTFWHFQRPSNKWLHGQRTTRTAGLRVVLGLNKRALFFHWECKRWFEQYFNICTKRNNANYNLFNTSVLFKLEL